MPQAQDLSMGSVQISGNNIVLVELEVADDRFPDVTFTGTAESVYEEMKALKPEAFPDTNALDVAQARSLHKRSTVSLQAHVTLGTLVMHAHTIVNSSTVNGAEMSLATSLATTAGIA